MSNELITLEHDGPITTLTVSRPEALNALNAPTLSALGTAVSAVAARSETRVLLVRGSGEKAFVAGADIAGMATMDVEAGSAFARLGDSVFAALEALPIPVIALVHGFALGGGCELALACDFIYASTRAKFGQPEVKLGIIPGFGGTQRLARRVGLAMAKELIFTGRMIDASEAQRVGLVNAVCEPQALLESARATAQEMVANGPLAIAAAKGVMQRGLSLPLSDAIEFEARAFGELFATSDQREGMDAFLRKRKALFTGH